MTYHFELNKKSAIAFGVGVLLFGVVMFFAGMVTEMLVARVSVPVETVENRQVGNQGLAASSGKKDGAQRSPIASSVPAPASTPAQTSGTEATGAAMPAAAPVLAPGSGLQLAVQVGTFDDPAQAKRQAEQLQKEGFTPRIAPQLGARNQEVSVVEVGPFSAWEQALQVAQLIGQSLGTRPAIRPML